VTEISAILDRRLALELGGLQLMFDTPMGRSITGRIEESVLQGRHRAVDGTLAPARHPGKGILGSGAKSSTRRRCGPARREISASASRSLIVGIDGNLRV
jgi:hypothetical protein